MAGVEGETKRRGVCAERVVGRDCARDEIGALRLDAVIDMVCISIAKRRLPIFAFIISSIGAIWVIMSSPPAPPPPRNCAFAGTLEIENSSSTAAAWQITLSAPLMTCSSRA